jgi:hypothetical protein
MAATPEKKVKDDVRKRLNARHVFHFMPATYGFGASGIADIVGCYLGKFFAIECKAGDNRPTMLQVKNLQRVSDAGGYAIVVNEKNLADVDWLLSKIEQDVGYQKHEP